MNKKYVEYIQRSINSISPYDQGHKQALYHTGFLTAILAELMLKDSKNFDIFTKKINELGNKKNTL